MTNLWIGSDLFYLFHYNVVGRVDRKGGVAGRELYSNMYWSSDIFILSLFYQFLFLINFKIYVWCNYIVKSFKNVWLHWCYIVMIFESINGYDIYILVRQLSFNSSLFAEIRGRQSHVLQQLHVLQKLTVHHLRRPRRPVSRSSRRRKRRLSEGPNGPLQKEKKGQAGAHRNAVATGRSL